MPIWASRTCIRSDAITSLAVLHGVVAEIPDYLVQMTGIKSHLQIILAFVNADLGFSNLHQIGRHHEPRRTSWRCRRDSRLLGADDWDQIAPPNHSRLRECRFGLLELASDRTPSRASPYFMALSQRFQTTWCR